MRPRKVRGGVKLPEGAGVGDASLGWAGQRWSRLVEQAAEGKRIVEGLEYAKAGQTRRLSVGPGLVDSAVQGRAERAYGVRLAFGTLTDEEWAKVVVAMGESAIYSAKLLSGEVPPNIEDVFIPLGLKLFPHEKGEVQVSCTCGDEEPWCKHVCCVAHLLASRLSREPFLMFAIRGLEGEDLRERLRQRRVTASAGTGPVPVYSQRVAGLSDAAPMALDANLENFWDAGPGLRELELPMGPPAVSHPLLRRLGPSPFQGAQFPLVGLLASCYDVISDKARQGAIEPRVEGEPSDADDPGETPAD